MLSVISSSRPATSAILYEKNKGLIANGLFGTNPLSIEKFFKQKVFQDAGITANHYLLPGSVDDMVKNSTVSIINYSHSSGMHYFAVEYNAAADKFYTYNMGPGETGKVDRGNSLDALFSHNDYTAFNVITLNK